MSCVQKKDAHDDLDFFEEKSAAEVVESKQSLCYILKSLVIVHSQGGVLVCQQLVLLRRQIGHQVWLCILIKLRGLILLN